jgi:hypothetical protein
VQSDLHISGGRDDMREWNGRVHADEATIWDAFASSMSVTIRMPDGREGQLLFLGNDGRVAGTGAAPFGDA